jgi:hypothetical protein
VKIPKHFRLYNHTIRVTVVSRKDWEVLAEEYDIENAVGVWRSGDQAIALLKQEKSMMLHTYCHELTHAILDTMNDKLSNNEKWVDQFAGLLAQAIETADK